MILVLDAYDSFVETLARYVRESGATTEVVRADAEPVEALLARNPTAILLSPGPRRPEDFPTMVEVCRRAPPELPMLGVCLGYQCIVEAFGGRTVRAPEPMHGRASLVRHDGDPLFDAVPSPFEAGRYHALLGDLASEGGMVPTAWLEDGTVMAARHRDRAVAGVQFHPESVLTPDGRRMIENFVRWSKAPR